MSALTNDMNASLATNPGGNADSAVPAPGRMARRSAPDWMREPLLHFVLLGALLFSTDHFLAERRGDPRIIVIDAEVDLEARLLFRSARGRDPTADELRALRERWVDNEVLYREGMALQVDRGDAAIRDRVIFKALSVVDANLMLPPFNERVLHDWFEAHRAKYDEPARYDFQEAVIVGDNSEAAVRAFAQALNAGTPGDAKAGLRIFKGRPQANLVDSYGPEFAKALAQSSVGEWRALPTRDGWRAMRLEAAIPANPAVFDNLRGVVLQDWTDATLAEQRTAAVRAMGKKYRVVSEAGTP